MYGEKTPHLQAASVSFLRFQRRRGQWQDVGSWPWPESQKAPIRAALGGAGGGGDRGCSHANVVVTIARGAPAPGEAKAGTKH